MIKSIQSLTRQLGGGAGVFIGWPLCVVTVNVFFFKGVTKKRIEVRAEPCLWIKVANGCQWPKQPLLLTWESFGVVTKRMPILPKISVSSEMLKRRWLVPRYVRCLSHAIATLSNSSWEREREWNLCEVHFTVFSTGFLASLRWTFSTSLHGFFQPCW